MHSSTQVNTLSGTQEYSKKAENPVPNLDVLQLPFTGERIVQVRTGKAKPFYNLPVTSAIYKSTRKDGVYVTFLGCEGDEHAYEFHGGVDKALHHYCSSHYSTWKSEYPQSAHRFNVGGFGENLVSNEANERNVFIGDIYQIGEELEVEVSLPRQPCYKLNHRFEVKDMSRQSQEKSRTGWYYRVLEEGYIRPGDEMLLLERPNPKWAVSDVQHFLYRDMNNIEAMKELVGLRALGKEARDIFANRLKKKFENQDQRLVGDEAFALNAWSDYRLVIKRPETPRIMAFVFEAVRLAKDVKPVPPGSHVRLKVAGKLMRAYSVVSGDNNRFELGVALDANSRGGSHLLHKSAREGDIFSVGEITTSFPLSAGADHQILIAGGIGITAFIPAAMSMQASGQPYTLHLAVRRLEDVPFKSYLKEFGDNVVIYDKSAGEGMNIKQVVGKANDNTHIYTCGPERLMNAVIAAAESSGVPKGHVHLEAFAAATSGDPFTAELCLSKKTLEVGTTTTLLDVLRDAGLDVSSSCEVGNCGTCRVNVEKGRIDHRGTGLLESDKEFAMLSCVSRGIGHIVLEL